MGIKHVHSKQLMVESDGSAFAKGLLRRNNKTFIGLPHTQLYLLVRWRKILGNATNKCLLLYSKIPDHP